MRQVSFTLLIMCNASVIEVHGIFILKKMKCLWQVSLLCMHQHGIMQSGMCLLVPQSRNNHRDGWGAFEFCCQRCKQRRVFSDQERKLGDRRRSDTALVLTINYATQELNVVLNLTHSAPVRNQSFWVLGGVWSQG